VSEALVIIDVQRGMFSFPDMQPHDAEGTVGRIADLLAQARSTATPVFFVQHEGEVGHPLERGTNGFPFHEALTPLDSESVTAKRHCNAFQETSLESALRADGIASLIVTGMQSNYCVDTFVRAAKERGFDIRLVADGHTTFDTPVLSADQIVAHHNYTLAGTFAELVAAKDVSFSE
jgi:nicotinamidase-related amidase